MWIKITGYSLYVSLFLQMAFSTIISVGIFLALVGVAHYLNQNGAIGLFESIKTEIFSETHHIYAGIFSIMAFFVISMSIISKLVKYIRVIEEGIKKLPDHNITYSIPVVGAHELARLAQSVNEIKEELRQKTSTERAHELHRKILITNISHDLRTPLTSVIGYLDLAKKEIPLHCEAYSYLEIAEKNSLRLKKLISDLFLYSKIISEDIKMDLQGVNIKILLPQILELKTYPITFVHKTEELILHINIEYFHRIMDNILDNAHKYSISERDITLTVYQDQKEAVIEVKNITKEDLSSKITFLTKRLYTADRNRNESSSGLGLSIVSELMKKMHGELHILFDEKEKIFTARLVFTKTLIK